MSFVLFWCIIFKLIDFFSYQWVDNVNRTVGSRISTGICEGEIGRIETTDKYDYCRRRSSISQLLVRWDSKSRQCVFQHITVMLSFRRFLWTVRRDFSTYGDPGYWFVCCSWTTSVSSISQRTMAEEHYRKLTLFICSFACYFARHNGFIFRNRYTLFYNPLMGRGNYSATSNNMKLVHWPLMGGLLHLVQRGGDRARLQPSQAPHCCTKCNSVPITILLYDGPLLWGFTVSVKSVQGLIIVEGKNC